MYAVMVAALESISKAWDDILFVTIFYLSTYSNMDIELETDEILLPPNKKNVLRDIEEKN